MLIDFREYFHFTKSKLFPPRQLMLHTQGEIKVIDLTTSTQFKLVQTFIIIWVTLAAISFDLNFGFLANKNNLKNNAIIAENYQRVILDKDARNQNVSNIYLARQNAFEEY